MVEIPENLEDEIKLIIAEIAECGPEEIGPDANFWTDLGVDSVKAIEITVAVEKKYKIAIRDEQIAKINTVRQAVELVREALVRKSV